MRRTFVALVLLLALGAAPAAAQPSPSLPDVTVDLSGHYEIRLHSPDLSFGGDVGRPVTNISEANGQDALGAFHEVDFDDAARSSGIRVYAALPMVLFTTTYRSDSPNNDPFPKLTSLPNLPYRLSYQTTPFSPYQLNSVANAADSPWFFFDASGSAFVISPASDFPVARMTLGSDGSLARGVDASVPTLPAGYTQQTLLVAGAGPNHVFDTWGAAMTTLHGKRRPSNDADVTLQKLGYWTDNGATYYYHFEPPLGYAGTLLAVKREFDQRGIALGYLQLDSWWYPKGPNARWDDREHGIFRYRAAPDLFPDGLEPFQQQVGLPLVTHARWIDPTSPYRGELAYSGNVMTDPRYWADLMGYLQAGGVVTYEQDWLGAQAQPDYELSAPRQFLDNMASTAAQHGLTLQYCMPLPRHVLQTVEYSNLTTMRVSDDRFDRDRWDTFLYTSRLASALGVWPWSDVFMSTERNNLLLADLSAGIVGIGDALGTADATNLRHVMRNDAVLVKPDVPLVPTDESMLAEAALGRTTPMVAWTYSDHGPLRTLYVFAYGRGDTPQDISFSPAALGTSGPTYVYDYFADSGRLLGANERMTASVSSGSYFVAAPLGPSGIAFLGDAGEFASLGRKRISELADDGVVRATVEFAAGEQDVTLFGYAPTAPSASASGGSVDNLAYDSDTHRFTLVLRADAAPSSVRVELSEVSS
jgi:hypothetical protein